MDPGPLRDALTLLGGVGSGLLSGAFGVGGAVISTPMIRLLGCSAALAVGTTLPAIVPGAVTGTMQYSGEGLIDGRVAASTIPAGVVAAVGGARLSKILPGAGHPLMILTAVLLMFSAYNLIRQRNLDDIEVHAAGVNRTLAAGLIGAAAGGLSGLLGVGGGVVMVPMFRKYLGLGIKGAVATSLVCVGAFAIPGTITQALQGGIEWRFALWLTIGAIPGALLGARAALRMSDRHQRRLFGMFLAAVAVAYAAGELAALV